MNTLTDELRRYQKAADVMEIEMMMGRYVTLMDQMDANAIYQELFACNDPEVSVEYTDNGKYNGPDHVAAYFNHLHTNLQNPADKTGWLDFTDAGTPDIVINDDETKAVAVWNLISPKAKVATPNEIRTLTQFWFGGKMYWELKKIDGVWKILHFRLVTYFTTPYEDGWVKNPECMREAPFWDLKPDERARFSVYNPAKYYVKGGQYTWGPYPPENGNF